MQKKVDPMKVIMDWKPKRKYLLKAKTDMDGKLYQNKMVQKHEKTKISAEECNSFGFYHFDQYLYHLTSTLTWSCIQLSPKQKGSSESSASWSQTMALRVI